eukprot:6197097-Pleurochrysis_carterae.AAC.3
MNLRTARCLRCSYKLYDHLAAVYGSSQPLYGCPRPGLAGSRLRVVTTRKRQRTFTIAHVSPCCPHKRILFLSSVSQVDE